MATPATCCSRCVLWVQLPGKADAVRLHDRSFAAGVSIAPRPIFSIDGKFRDFVRLNSG
jgi:DNA-binding transcriptional MocR family regulator